MGEPLRVPGMGERPVSSVHRRADRSTDSYASLPYHLTVVRDGEEKARPWLASVEELAGCTSRGRTPEEALSGARAAMTRWIETALEDGREDPGPPGKRDSSRLVSLALAVNFVVVGLAGIVAIIVLVAAVR